MAYVTNSAVHVKGLWGVEFLKSTAPVVFEQHSRACMQPLSAVDLTFVAQFQVLTKRKSHYGASRIEMGCT